MFGKGSKFRRARAIGLFSAEKSDLPTFFGTFPPGGRLAGPDARR